jgi:hypothetical protein
MNLIINFIVALFTLPGVVVHEVSHKFFCDWSGVKVLKVCYFRFGNPSGFVIHEAGKKFSQSFFISMGPLILGIIFSALFFQLFKIHSNELKGIIFAWIGLMIATKCFPSSADAKNLWEETKRHFWRSPFAFIGFPFALFIWLINRLNVFYFNYIFALFLFWLVVIY